MYKYIDNYVNTNHVTQIPYPVHLPLPHSHFIPVILSGQENYCRKCYIYTVCYFSNWYYFLLPYCNSIEQLPFTGIATLPCTQ